MYLSYFIIFFQSNLLELPVTALYYRKTDTSLKRRFAVVTLSNLITHPLVFFAFMTSNFPYLTATLAAEAFAIIAEAFLHYNFIPNTTLGNCFKSSAVANLVSWQLAPLFTWLFFYIYRM